MKNLFICCTPLHCLIVKRIIEVENLPTKDNEILYVSYRNEDQMIHQKYYSRLSDNANKSHFIEVNKKIFLYFIHLRKILGKRKFNNVYIANINMPIVHFILSIIRFDNLFSFDDGVGNIVNGSELYKEKKTFKSLIRNIIYFCLGKRFNLDKIKANTRKHYTIYKNKENIHNILQYVNIFEVNNFYNNPSHNQDSYTVVLGTVYSEVISDIKYKQKIINKLQLFITSCNDEIIYIPHPRDQKHYFSGITYFNDNEIAEFKLHELLITYNKIKLFGFTSTAQFNISSQQNVDNFYFYSHLLRNDYLYLYCEKANQFNFGKLDLDVYKSI